MIRRTITISMKSSGASDEESAADDKFNDKKNFTSSAPRKGLLFFIK